VLETLFASRDHLSALQIHKVIAARHAQITESAVRRVLLDLAAEHVIHVIDQPGRARYGLADRRHHHAVCAVCGQTTEIPAGLTDSLIEAIAASTGYRFEHHGITLTGTCATCG
jgi:Fur family ferric uptake transcriptional regulator